MYAMLFRKDFSRKLTLIFAASYALAALAIFMDMFFWLMMGNAVQLQEPNVVIAASELVSTLTALAILVLYLLELLGIKESSYQDNFTENHDRNISPLSADLAKSS